MVAAAAAPPAAAALVYTRREREREREEREAIIGEGGFGHERGMRKEEEEEEERWTTTTTAAAAGRATSTEQTEQKRATTPYRGSVGFDTFTENYIVTTTDPTALPILRNSFDRSVHLLSNFHFSNVSKGFIKNAHVRGTLETINSRRFCACMCFVHVRGIYAYVCCVRARIRTHTCIAYMDRRVGVSRFIVI